MIKQRLQQANASGFWGDKMTENKKKRVFTVLSIDGGGIRGVVPARILQEIEERTGKPIAELFDMVGGTSTGAILGAGLVVPDEQNPTKPKHSAQELKNFYYTFGPKIFPELRFKSIRKLSSSALYDPKPLEDALKEKLGDYKMKDSLTHLLIPATDIKNFRPVWIAHIKGQKDKSPEGWSSMLMRDAVRASTTAPTYFPSKYYSTTPNEDMPNVTHRHALIDGGFFAGNSMRRLMTQARKLAPPDAEIVVVHLGTGNVENSLSPEEFNKLGPIGMISKSNGNLLLSLVINMSLMDVANDIRDEIGDRFISFDGIINGEADPAAPTSTMDDASLKNLKALEKFAEKIIKDNDAEMERLCDILKHRVFAEEYHQESKNALQKLTAILEDTKTVKTLTKTYKKILGYASDIVTDTPEAGDAELKMLAQALTEQHKHDLDRIYHVVQDKLDGQNKILNSIKEAGDDLTKFVKKLGSPFRPLPPSPDNDNTEANAQPWKHRAGDKPKQP
ncbi:MAG: patatin family protein [Alphaproteobacteria bacterium]|jgi:patatin-like phospholipase/acyl hydrolase|nr:patatin family protein [Alphaproteobacteria bacterium]